MYRAICSFCGHTTREWRTLARGERLVIACPDCPEKFHRAPSQSYYDYTERF